MSPHRPGRAPAVLKLAVLGILLVGGFLVARLVTPGEAFFHGTAARSGARLWGPTLFVTLYAGGTALGMPGAALTLAGGALFGSLWGSVLSTVAANLGASAAFFVARALGRDGLERLAGPKLSRFDDVVCHYGLQCLLVLRLIPLVPFNVLNFASGLTALRWRTYVLATAVGILPGTVVYTVFADAILESSRGASRAAYLTALVSGGLLALMSFLPAVRRRLAVAPSGGTAD